MSRVQFLLELFLNTVGFRLARSQIKKPENPIALTYSVTAACQSRCKTCNIGRKYQQDPKRKDDDLALTEIEKIFKGLGHIYFFNISGGEPFLRKDLAEIVDLACRHLKPKIIHIPTNAIASEAVRDLTWSCLEIIGQYDPKLPLTVKPSIDGIGELHDEIRGVRGNFRQLKTTIKYLKDIEAEYDNFHLELGTVVSRFNINHLSEIEDYVHSLGVQSYRNEIAENRTEFFNLQEDISPDPDTYESLIEEFSAKIRRNIKRKRHLTRLAEAFRLTYYDLAIKILRERRQVIPCFAGISNVHINYDGEVWPCCVLGYAKPMGALRKEGYDFQKVWHSDQAREVRTYIQNGCCACPLANQAYSNILCNSLYLARSIKKFIMLFMRQ
ncbi:MAG: radical SAM protein [Deltaproteobacteria bacterium]|nr:radical SAM protein [Deltaproteobacteria bacterium]